MGEEIYNIIKKKSPNFPLEKEDILKIREILIRNDNLSIERIDDEMKYFFTELIFPNYYFRVNKLEEVARIIETVNAYKILGGNIAIEKKSDTGFVYIVPANEKDILNVERKIDNIVAKALSENMWIEVDMHRTKGKLLGNYLNVYIVDICSKEFDNKRKLNEIASGVKKYINEKYKKDYKNEDIIEYLNTKSERYIEKSEVDRISRYFISDYKLKDDFLPDVSISLTSDRTEYRFMITFDSFYFKKSYSFLTSLFFCSNLTITRSYLSISKKGDKSTITISYYISSKVNKERVEELRKNLQTALILPDTKVTYQLFNKKFNLEEIFFLNSFAEFAHQFLRTKDNILDVIKELIENNDELQYSFTEFQMKVEHEMFAMRTIQEIILRYENYSRLLYRYFDEKLNPEKKERDFEKIKRKLKRLLNKERNDIVVDIFNIGILFVDNILRTNFYKEKKAALSFKLNPLFLDKDRIPEFPYSIFYFYGMDFKGYHIRFQDIARGGVRIVKSRTKEEYLKNSDDNFLEVYNLAYTQEKKNKDIPEGGAKGIILPYFKVKDFNQIFYSYIDSMLDLMLKDSRIVNIYDNKEDIIFLGPDEGSAHLMDWAALYAKKRGYRYWRAFTTGKSDNIGGISHIEYGMTTTGVHEYVLQLLKELGLEEDKITKVQTGGPDGDLGSNEILISKDKTIAVIDGSGVAYDPEGLDRNELKRLAKKHIPIINFDKSKLSKNGFVVGINEDNLKIKEFHNIRNGMDLRNKFHFLVSADLLLPAGGRPRTIDIGNWENMILPDGSLRYKYIVEGANLFITQPARIKLENAGVILFKDSSANKGGVTSSSLEVLSSLVMEDDEFEKLMCRYNKETPDFRKKYIEDILEIIKKNARKEFNILWFENKSSGEPISILSDKLSELIIKISNLLKKSTLIKNKFIREFFIKNFIPPTLLKKYSLEKILNRLPENYIEAVVSKEIGSFFVYNTGIYWIETIHKEYKKEYEKIVEAYLKAYFEINDIIVKNKFSDKRIYNLLEISVKERALQFLSKGDGAQLY